jgi:hypothetical protein
MSQHDGWYAPWTNAQVQALWVWQLSGRMHPYTCPNRSDGNHNELVNGDHGVLAPSPLGWVCRDCDYKQDWAHAFNADELLNIHTGGNDDGTLDP